MADGVTLLIGPQVLAASLAPHPRHAGHRVARLRRGAGVPGGRTHGAAQRPRVVALPEKFALSPRGTALTHRIAVDAQLAGTQVARDRHRGLGDSAVSEGARPTWLPLDATGTRRVPRIRMRQGLDVQIDGATAALVDLSTMGAQVVSTTVLEAAPARARGRSRSTPTTSGPPASWRGRCSRFRKAGCRPATARAWSSPQPTPNRSCSSASSRQPRPRRTRPARAPSRTTPPPAARCRRWCRRARRPSR